MEAYLILVVLFLDVWSNSKIGFDGLSLFLLTVFELFVKTPNDPVIELVVGLLTQRDFKVGRPLREVHGWGEPLTHVDQVAHPDPDPTNGLKSSQIIKKKAKALKNTQQGKRFGWQSNHFCCPLNYELKKDERSI